MMGSVSRFARGRSALAPERDGEEIRGVAKGAKRWELTELIDLETALSSWDGKVGKRSGGRGERGDVIREWLAGHVSRGPGRRWVAALGLAGATWSALAFVVGAGAAWGTLDRQSGGVNVLWFLGVVLVVPWLLMLGAVVAWLFRGRVAGAGLSASALAALASKIAGEGARSAYEKVHRSGDLGRALGWRLTRLAQYGAEAFHAGAMAGLWVMVLVKRVSFFWETTTETAMEKFLEGAVEVMAAPWTWRWMEWVPDVAASRRTQLEVVGGESWWPFLLLSLAVWGVLPRFLLARVAWWQERRVMINLTFQAPQHRKLWRALTDVRRGEDPKGPTDGALVIGLGQSMPARETLRPFLLRRLRMNPTGWESLGVLDGNREDAARMALERAPAGVVLLAEGWSLAPRQVKRALEEVRARSGERRIVLVVGNPRGDGGLKEVEPGERTEWERFLDGLEGEELELVFYEES